MYCWSVENYAERCRYLNAHLAFLFCLTIILPVSGFTQNFDAPSLWREARSAESHGDVTRATVAYDQLVRRFNDPLAMFNLGFYYKDGKGVPTDIAMAISLWRRSIDSGYEQYDFGSNMRNVAYRGAASTQLGFLYLKGSRPQLPPNSSLALQWNLRGASLGHTNAYSNLALIYSMGFGVNRNYGIAINYLIKSVEAYSDEHKWLLHQPDEWKTMLKKAPPELWRARDLYWEALKTGNKQLSIDEMRRLEMTFRSSVEPVARTPRTGERIVKECLARGHKPGTQQFSDCVSTS